MTDPFPSVELQRLWSVTTLIKAGLGNGEQLIQWAANVTADLAVEDHEQIAAWIKRGEHDRARKYLASARRQTSKEAKARGSDVHMHAEAIALGAEPVGLTDAIRPYVEQYQSWLAAFQPEFLMAEAPVYNVTKRYAGTLDGIIELPGHPLPLVVDYKTTPKAPGADVSRPPYPEVALQLAAYANAELVGVLSEQRYDAGRRFYLFDPNAAHQPLPEVDRNVGLCIVISPFDCLAVPVRIAVDVWEAFQDVQMTARWTTDTSRGVFGAPLAAAPQPLTREAA